MNLPSLKGLFSGGIKEAVKVVADTVDRFTLSGEEKAAISQAMEDAMNAHAEKMEALAVDREKIFLQDTENARAMNVALNASEHASWLTKNTGSMIAIAYTVFNFVIYVLILMGWAKTDNDIAILIVNSITNIAMLIVGFYYGSSSERNRTRNVQIQEVKTK